MVVGLGVSGLAACRLLAKHGAQVTGLDDADTKELRKAAKEIESLGGKIIVGKALPAKASFDLVVVSPGIPGNHVVPRNLAGDGVPVISELELGYQHSYCLNVAVTGTNGKTTVAGLIEAILTQNQHKTLVAGSTVQPICAVADQTKDLDFLTLEVNSFQLEHIKYFRPSVAVMLNITPDHQDRYGSLRDYLLTKARVFTNQQPFDWAIMQSEVLAQLQIMDVKIPSKIITFSANNRRADIWLERGLIISRLAGWTGPLLNMDNCRLRGPHNAENLMAALAVGRVLRVPLDSMLEPLQTFTPPPHRCEFVMEIDGVQYVNDAKSTNVDSLHKALLSLPAAQAGEPNVWLIAGGRSKGTDYHDVGPLLSQRVKGAILMGEARHRLRSAWSLFTPCTLVESLLEGVVEAARNARPGDIVLLSPACSSYDQFESYRHRGESFRQAVKELAQTAMDPHHSANSG